MLEEDIRKELFSLRDNAYFEFHKKLIPTVDEGHFIGVRTPQVRALAKRLHKDGRGAEYIKILPHKYYDEYNLHGFLIEEIRDYDSCIEALNEFLPYIDNWATCDMTNPKILKKYPERLLQKSKEWINSDHEYTVRFGIETLMRFFLSDNFNREILDIVADVNRSEYYIMMMKAWFFATALAMQYDSTIGYIENKRLDIESHNMTIRKAIESYRITKEQKEYLRTLKQNGDVKKVQTV